MFLQILKYAYFAYFLLFKSFRIFLHLLRCINLKKQFSKLNPSLMRNQLLRRRRLNGIYENQKLVPAERRESNFLFINLY